jgi:hypothetical protein
MVQGCRQLPRAGRARKNAWRGSWQRLVSSLNCFKRVLRCAGISRSSRCVRRFSPADYYPRVPLMLCASNAAPAVRAGGKSLRRVCPVLPEERIHKDVDTRRHLTKNVLSFFRLESRFYAVLSKAASSGLASNPRRSKSREPKRRQKAAKVFE